MIIQDKLLLILVKCIFIKCRTCVENCEKSGCINDTCYTSCQAAVNGDDKEEKPKSKCPYDDWIQWDCTNECKYQCMIIRETERREIGQVPVKYHGKWPIVRMLGLQVCHVSVIMSFSWWFSWCRFLNFPILGLLKNWHIEVVVWLCCWSSKDCRNIISRLLHH